MTGHGTKIWPEGHSYTGNWKDGQHHGHGTKKMVNGTTYVGMWDNGMMEGRGTVTFQDGTTRTGIFKNGIYKGKELPKSKECMEDLFDMQNKKNRRFGRSKKK